MRKGILSLIGASLVILASVACSRPKGSGGPSASPAENIPRPSPFAAPMKVLSSPRPDSPEARRGPGAGGQEAPVPIPYSAEMGRGGSPALTVPQGYQNLVVGSWEVRMPEDFDLGPLQNRSPAEPQAAARAQAAYAFMDAVLAKDVPPELIVPERKDALKRSLASLLAPSRSISSYRMGSIVAAGETANANIFVYSGTARAHGVIYLLRSEGSWLVDGFDLDGTALDKERPETARRYELTEYRAFFY